MGVLDIEILKQFFSAYFHEDWPLEAAEPAGVVALYLETTPDAAELRALSESLEAFANQHVSDGQLEEALFRELGGYYMPSADGLSTQAWLRSVAAALRARA